MYKQLWDNLFIKIWQLCFVANLIKQQSSFNYIRFVTVTLDITTLFTLKPRHSLKTESNCFLLKY